MPAINQSIKHQDDHSFSKRIFRDFSMTKKNENHNLSAQHIFPNK